MDGRNSGARIFDADALVRGQAHAGGTGEKNVGRGLRMGDRARVGDKVELACNAEQAHDVGRVPARRCKADLEPRRAAPVEQLADTRKQVRRRIGRQPRAIELVLFGRSEEHTSELQSLMRTSYA